jgi:putative acetyltransferase
MRQARTAAQIEEARTLFLEYAKSLDFDLCFQGFERELAWLPGDYAPPEGRLLLAGVEGQAEGCVALRAQATGICELKRLYVRPQFRGKRLGRALVEAAITEARTIGYRGMRLDTIGSSMRNAVALYRLLGFKEIAPYRSNPIPGACYMELELKQASGPGCRESLF